MTFMRTRNEKIQSEQDGQGASCVSSLQGNGNMKKTTTKTKTTNEIKSLGVCKLAYASLQKADSNAKALQFVGDDAGCVNRDGIGAGTLAASRALECGIASVKGGNDSVVVYSGAQGFGFAVGTSNGDWFVLNKSTFAVKFGSEQLFIGTVKETIAFIKERGAAGELEHATAGKLLAWAWGKKYGIAITTSGKGMTRLESGTDKFSKSTGLARGADWQARIIKTTRESSLK